MEMIEVAGSSETVLAEQHGVRFWKTVALKRAIVRHWKISLLLVSPFRPPDANSSPVADLKFHILEEFPFL
jgi:hypothetical protein